MADSILRLKVESQEYDSKLKRAAEGIQRLASKIHDSQGEFVGLTNDQKEFIKNLQYMNTVSQTATGKVKELETAYKGLQTMYNGFNAFEKNSEEGKILAEQLSVLKEKTLQARKEMEDANKSLSNTGGFLDQLTSKFTVNIDALKLFDIGMKAAGGALDVAKDAFFQSESNIDEWGRTVKGAEGAYNVFLDTLNNGNWSNFFDNLSKAIQGGRDLYDVFDRLGSIKSNNAAAIAIVQQEIAQLRLAKQQGENVDAQLKAATARLAELQKQSINAGKEAGTKSAFEVVRSGVNSVGGAHINDATINYAVGRIMKYGQSEFDKYKHNRDVLYQRGLKTVVTPGVGWDSQGNPNPNTSRQVFDINLLTKEQQKQYALAQAITEGETRIQRGIAAYAQAVQEGTSSAREEFKGNRYALQGAGGSGGGGKGGGGKGFDISSIAFDANKAMLAAVKGEGEEGPSEVWKAITQGAQESTTEVERLTAALEKLNEVQGVTTGEAVKDSSNMADKWQKAGTAISAVGSAMSSIEDPAAKVAGTIAQAIASVALGYATATAQAGSMGPWAWVAFAATGLAEMLTMISTIHSATGYASGGIVDGNSFSGDNVPAMVGNTVVGLNAGELILNKSQQNNIASQLTQAGGGGRLVAKLKGRDILISLERELSETGKGQLATWR